MTQLNASTGIHLIAYSRLYYSSLLSRFRWHCDNAIHDDQAAPQQPAHPCHRCTYNYLCPPPLDPGICSLYGCRLSDEIYEVILNIWNDRPAILYWIDCSSEHSTLTIIEVEIVNHNCSFKNSKTQRMFSTFETVENSSVSNFQC